MRASSLLTIFSDLLQTSVVARAQYLMAKAHHDREGMLDAVKISLAVDQDVISLLTGSAFETLELSAKERLPKIEGTPEEIIELMREIMRQQTASLGASLAAPLHDVPEIEEVSREIRNRKMKVVGDFFRRAKRVLKEQWDAWSPEYDREFRSMLKT